MYALQEWSKAIKNNFISKNYPPSPRNGQEKADIETLLKKQYGMERMMMQDRVARRESEAKNSLLAEEVGRLREEHRRRDATDAHRDAQIQYHRAMLEALLRNQGVALPTQPHPANKRPRLVLPPQTNAATSAAAAAGRPPSPPANSAATSASPRAATAGAAPTATDHLSAAAAAATTAVAAAAAAPSRLRWTERTTTDTTKSDANITVSYTLREMNLRGMLQNGQDISLFCAPKHQGIPFIDRNSNGKKMNNCLRLVKKVWTPGEEQIIRSPPVGTDMTKKAELMRVADAIQQRCLSKMTEYETKAKMKPKKGGSAKFSGLGERIRLYEKHIKENPGCDGESIITG